MKFLIGIFTVLIFFSLSVTAQAQETGTISGKVETADGKGFGGVKVVARNRQTNAAQETTSAADGKYSLTVEPGNYTLTLELEGYQTATLQQAITVEARQAAEVKPVRLTKEQPYSLIRGRVFTAEGQSIAGATITLERLDVTGKKFKQTKESNSAGTFAFRLPAEAGRYRLTASIKGLKAASQEVEVEQGEARSIAFKLAP